MKIGIRQDFDTLGFAIGLPDGETPEPKDENYLTSCFGHDVIRYVRRWRVLRWSLIQKMYDEMLAEIEDIYHNPTQGEDYADER